MLVTDNEPQLPAPDAAALRKAFPPAADLQALEDSLVKGDA